MKNLALCACLLVVTGISHAAPPLEPEWTVTNCAAAPSHALYDPNSKSLYISQISGEGDKKDGVGLVSRLDLEGNVLECEWVGGLDAPKGIARHGKTLWVSDIDRLHQIDAKTGKVTACLDVPKAKFLTGVTVDSQGSVYVADMLASRIYQYRDERFSTFVAGDGLESPAGLAAGDDCLIVAAWGLTTDFNTEVPGGLFAIEQRKLRMLSKPLGNMYGVVSDGSGGWIATDFATGRVLHVTEKAEPRVLLQLPPGAGGVEYVSSRKLLIVPEVTQNRISAFDLSSVLKNSSR